jgi:toluene monooxygenase electron transfer component
LISSTQKPVLKAAQIRASGKADTVVEFECDKGESILHAGLRAGFTLPYECASGTCGTCKAVIESGEIVCDWPEAPGHKTVKPDRREFLMCQSRAVGNVNITIERSLKSELAGRLPPSRSGASIELYRRLNDDVIFMSLRLDAPTTFAAGQFALLTVAGVVGSRAYSMVNFALDTSQIDLLVKRLPGGGLTSWLFEKDRTGAEVQIFGPLGMAVFEPELGHPLCLMAGGSGIAGMMAILEQATTLGYFATLSGDVFFGVRTGADVFFLNELSALVEIAGSNLSVTVALSHDQDSRKLSTRFPLLCFQPGFVHDVARPVAVRLENAMYFVAGPPPMVDAALRMLLLEAKAPARRIRYDKFS